jgi:hypothetical protein
MQICTFSVHVSTKSWFLFYTAERSADCVGKINPGETKTCTPSPSRTAHLTVITRVDNTGCMDQCAKASNFEITVAGGFYAASPGTFQGSEQGTDVTLVFTEPEDYNVGADIHAPFVGKYQTSFSSECSGIVHGGDSKTCII